jgi:hypothetical protein
LAPPVFINNRDRLTPLAQMIDWLEAAGVEEIYVLDNDSAYEPLLEYYERSPHTIVRLGGNVGKNALWDAPGVFDLTRGRHFAYSDSDVVPTEDCPPDALDHFVSLLERYQGINKAGFGIRYDDIPQHYPHRAEAVSWEKHQESWPLERNVYYATIDTQFAVYRPHGQPRPHSAARTGSPYVARHTSYYLDFANLSAEDAFYERRAEETRAAKQFTYWASPQLSPHAKSKEVPFPGPVTRLRWRLRGRRAVRTGAHGGH